MRTYEGTAIGNHEPDAGARRSHSQTKVADGCLRDNYVHDIKRCSDDHDAEQVRYDVAKDNACIARA